ncbi:MAG: hypothetical protein J6U74_03710 [Clostridia bacterium]|nr:hypothetical protein [Clostridia bacterium]
MIVGYGVMMAISLVLIAVYYTAIKKREFWLGLLFVCVALVNTGYFMLSLSKTVQFALFANDMAYLGSVFLMMCMLFTIVKLCGYNVKKELVIALTTIAGVMYFIIATSGWLPWYYKSVAIDSVDGATVLVKEYGPLHSVYLVYLVLYFVAMIAIIVQSIVKKKVASQKLAVSLAIVVLMNLAVWFVEKFVEWNFETLSVSYVASEVLFVLLYWLMQDSALAGQITTMANKAEELGLNVSTLTMEAKINKIIATLPEGVSLANREREILEKILESKKRKDIAFEMCLSENTVKTYTRNLYNKLNVGSREELNKLLLESAIGEACKLESPTAENN